MNEDIVTGESKGLSGQKLWCFSPSPLTQNPSIPILSVPYFLTRQVGSSKNHRFWYCTARSFLRLKLHGHLDMKAMCSWSHAWQDTVRGREAIYCQGCGRAPLRGSVSDSKLKFTSSYVYYFGLQLKHSSQANTGSTYIKNYSFDFDFGPPWGNCNAVMTCVSGHLTKLDFGPEFNNWSYPPPEKLFDGPVHITIDDVSQFNSNWFVPNYIPRAIKLCRRTLNA